MTVRYWRIITQQPPGHFSSPIRGSIFLFIWIGQNSNDSVTSSSRRSLPPILNATLRSSPNSTPRWTMPMHRESTGPMKRTDCSPCKCASNWPTSTGRARSTIFTFSGRTGSLKNFTSKETRKRHLVFPFRPIWTAIIHNWPNYKSLSSTTWWHHCAMLTERPVSYPAIGSITINIFRFILRKN